MQVFEPIDGSSYSRIYSRTSAQGNGPAAPLCMDNQTCVQSHSTVVSTLNRNFTNRSSDGANVQLASAELVFAAWILGRLPIVGEYNEYAATIDSVAADV